MEFNEQLTYLKHRMTSRKVMSTNAGFHGRKTSEIIVIRTILVQTCRHNDFVFINIHEVERLSPNNVTHTDVCSDPGRIYNYLPKLSNFLTSLQTNAPSYNEA